MTPEQIRWLTWGATQHRPHGAPKWDEPGTHKAITDHCRSWDFAAATQHVLAHARDPKARTPFAIKGNPPHTEPERSGTRWPAKAESECRVHPGEWAYTCRACASDLLAGDKPPTRKPQPADDETKARALAAARAALRPQEPA